MKKFLTVLLVISVMFTFSFGSAFAGLTAEAALAEALANAKASAIQSLEGFVRLSDYDAEGQVEVKELIEEGTMLIEMQTELNGVSATLAAYQNKLVNVKNANVNALAAAKKAAKEAIEDYADALFATGCYAKAFNVAKFTKEIDAQQVVVGVELVKAQAYAEFEKVEMTVPTDAAAAKALAEAKVAAIEVVKGLAKNGAWAKIDEEKATDAQIAAYKAKVNEVVTAIKAAKSEAAIVTILEREAAEVANLAAKTEKASAQASVRSGLYDWAHGLDYVAYVGDYAVIKNYIEKVTFNGKDALDLNGEAVYDANEDRVIVDELKDVDAAVEAGKEYILDKIATSLTVDAAADALKLVMADANVKADKTVVTQSMFLDAVRNLETATTSKELAAKQAATTNEWYALAKAEDAAYADAIEKLEKTIADAKKAIEATDKTETAADDWNADAANAVAELWAAVLADAQAERNYPIGYTVTIEENVKAIQDATESIRTATYAEVLEMAQKHFVTFLPKIHTLDETKECKELLAAQVKAVEAATTITAAYAAFDAGCDTLYAYGKAAADTSAIAKKFAAFKAAEAVVLALPGASAVTLGDEAAYDAAYEAYVFNKNVYVDAYEEAYGDADTFVGEVKADDKLAAVGSALEGLAGKLQNYKDAAYNTYLKPAKFEKYTAAQQSALTAAYNAGVAAIKAASETGYADDVDYVIEDAVAALAKVVKKADEKALADMIADAKAALGVCYDAAEYSAAGLAKIAEIIATVDAATDGEEVAKLTVAARKAIAGVEETIVDTDAAIINSVQGLKIKARTDVAKKGSITVRWSVIEGDTSYVEGYEIWKSTKHSSGYKKMITKSADSDWYKNTKGLEKGTRYYFKVRAIAHTTDGTKVKSDFSNKARRIAK